MAGEAPATLGAALRVPKAPAGSRWVRCEGCRESWLLPQGRTLCPDCDEKRQREAEGRRILAWRREHRQALLTSGGIPPRLAEVPPPSSIPAACDPWHGAPWSLTLLGTPGSGKSALAVEIAYRWLAADPKLKGFRWVRADTLVRDILQSRRTGHQERRAPLLILDHLGDGACNPTAWAVLGEVLAERHDWQRPTLVTTNLTQAALEAAHPATADRLRSGLLCPLPRPRGGKR